MGKDKSSGGTSLPDCLYIVFPVNIGTQRKAESLAECSLGQRPISANLRAFSANFISKLHRIALKKHSTPVIFSIKMWLKIPKLAHIGQRPRFQTAIEKAL